MVTQNRIPAHWFEVALASILRNLDDVAMLALRRIPPGRIPVAGGTGT